jgi:PRTRC genetic system protein C
MHNQNSTQKSALVRRIFRYGDHEFDDPGQEYTVDQVRQALLPYFPELVHATTDEKRLEDGTLQIAFRTK